MWSEQQIIEKNVAWSFPKVLCYFLYLVLSQLRIHRFKYFILTNFQLTKKNKIFTNICALCTVMTTTIHFSMLLMPQSKKKNKWILKKKFTEQIIFITNTARKTLFTAQNLFTLSIDKTIK